MPRRLGQMIAERADELARLQVCENGKVLREVLAQTRGLAGYCDYFAGLAETTGGTTIPSNTPGMCVYTVREPGGVVAAVTPWNSRLALLMWNAMPGPGDAVTDTAAAARSAVETPLRRRAAGPVLR